MIAYLLCLLLGLRTQRRESFRSGSANKIPSKLIFSVEREILGSSCEGLRTIRRRPYKVEFARTNVSSRPVCVWYGSHVCPTNIPRAHRSAVSPAVTAADDRYLLAVLIEGLPGSSPSRGAYLIHLHV